MRAIHPRDLAAKTRCGQCLPGIADIARVEAVADASHYRDRSWAEHLRHVARLVRPDTMLTGDRSTRGDARLEDQPRKLECAIRGTGLFVVVQDEGVQIAVARVEHVGDAQPVLRRQRADLLE